MRISELTTEQAADMLCEITPFVANLTSDEKLANTLKDKLKPSEGMSTAEILAFGANKITMIVPVVLKDHRNDLFGVLAVLNRTTPEAIARQNIIRTMKQVREAVKDKELVDFFKSWQQAEEKE